jgi:hypothetical protein
MTASLCPGDGSASHDRTAIAVATKIRIPRGQRQNDAVRVSMGRAGRGIALEVQQWYHVLRPLPTLPPTLRLPPDEGAHAQVLRRSRLRRSAARLLRAESDPRVGLLAVLFVALMRVALEGGSSGLGLGVWLPILVERLTFYTALFLAFCGALRLALPARPRGIPSVVAIGLLLGVCPPLLGQLMPVLGGSAYPRVTAWQWHFYAPEELALVETLTLWFTVLLCGAFTRWVSGSWGRALIASVVGWGGLAAIVVVFPSVLAEIQTGGAPPRTSGADLVLAMACIVIVVLMHPPLVRVLVGRIPRAVPFTVLMVLGALQRDPSFRDVLMRSLLLVWLLVATVESPPVDPGRDWMFEAGVAWPVALSLLVLSNVLLLAPMVALTGAASLLSRLVVPMFPAGAGIPGVRLGAHAMTALCAVLLGAAPGPGRPRVPPPKHDAPSHMHMLTRGDPQCEPPRSACQPISRTPAPIPIPSSTEDDPHATPPQGEIHSGSIHMRRRLPQLPVHLMQV